MTFANPSPSRPRRLDSLIRRERRTRRRGGDASTARAPSIGVGGSREVMFTSFVLMAVTGTVTEVGTRRRRWTDAATTLARDERARPRRERKRPNGERRGTKTDEEDAAVARAGGIVWKTHAFAKPSPTRKRNARVRHRDREDAIAPCVGAITDRTHIFLRVRVTRKPLGSFETSRRRSKKPRASTPRRARRRRTEPEAHPNPPTPP